MKLQLYYPVRPHKVNQVWGIKNPIYQQFGFSRHNGEDLALVNGQSIAAPFNCEVVRTGSQPKGGGIFIGILSKNFYEFPDGKSARVLIDFLHCQKLIVSEGQQVQVGEIVALGDNTGVSTGPHTHMQLRRVTWDEKELVDMDKNDANNSFDPDPYWTGVYADSWVWLRQVISIWNTIKGRTSL